jgi:tripartite ATP-independent transporter DctM subunit
MTAFFIVLVLLLLTGVPIYFVLGGACAAFFLQNQLPMWTVLQRQFVGLNSFVMMAVPLFILCGNLMDSGGTLKRIVRFAQVCVGGFKGGIAHVNVLASLLFAGVTGSAVADVAALGPLEIEMMTDAGYEKEFSTALTCAAASIGPIIPPSLPLIMFGVVTGTSVGNLLMAGILPGILMSLTLMGMVAYYAHKENFPTSAAYPFSVIVKEFFSAVGPILLPVIVLVGIYSGFFTPTEAAGIACLWAFVIGMFVYKELHWSDLPEIFKKTARTMGNCTGLFAIASCFSYVITYQNIPATVSQLLIGITSNKFLMLLMINVLLLLIGCFMEGISAILITAPLFVPVLAEFGVDPIQIGVLMAINTTLGLLTPPLGLSLFMASSITGIPVLRLAKRVMPMFAVLVLYLFFITYVPEISLLIPHMMVG